ncbi:hypothetical protein FOZ63_025342 [Perkinsus olseni]|uniref:Uncharacterized protein n=1 Tax=Perkinsus olseni TaxID=32597 RepID=A0A7J6N7B5_PEROL|nr:hypothetical protein FOZ60_014480 [Perkinsus olseni]KAF4734600.1 hypothetical protein FOZ63_025342 [Perkinsus olseni]
MRGSYCRLLVERASDSDQSCRHTMCERTLEALKLRERSIHDVTDFVTSQARHDASENPDRQEKFIQRPLELTMKPVHAMLPPLPAVDWANCRPGPGHPEHLDHVDTKRRGATS